MSKRKYEDEVRKLTMMFLERSSALSRHAFQMRHAINAETNYLSLVRQETWNDLRTRAVHSCAAVDG